MEMRAFGQTGERLSIVGFGGILVMDEEPAEAARIVAAAVDRGINYFDVAPSYGNAQERLGPALRPYRSRVFLACKTGKRTRVEAEAELARSLQLLETDHVDLYQHHGVTKLEEVERIMGPGGAMEAFIAARRKGQVRFLGFSAHSEEAALAMMERYPFDSVLFPFTWSCWLVSGFGKAVLESAERKGIARLALKTMALRSWKEGEGRVWRKAWYRPVETAAEAELAVGFTLSKPITSAVSPGHERLLWLMCDAAEHWRLLTSVEERELARRARELPAIFPQKP